MDGNIDGIGNNLTLIYTMLPSSGPFNGGPEVQSTKTLNITYFFLIVIMQFTICSGAKLLTT